MYELSRYSTKLGFSREMIASPMVDSSIFDTDPDILAYRFLDENNEELSTFSDWVVALELKREYPIPDDAPPELVMLFKRGSFLEIAVEIFTGLRVRTTMTDVEICNKILKICQLRGLEVILEDKDVYAFCCTENT